MNQPPDEKQRQPEELSRRDFLKRVGYASALALAAGGLGWALYDRQGPAPAPSQKVLTGLGDYALPALTGKPGKMAIVKGTDRMVMVEQGIKALGGMEYFIQKGDRVISR
ncbi:MAG: twin-arginine translocation signal domain-containing protein [Syntrophobacterales bacterium]